MKESKRVLFIGSKRLGLRCLEEMYELSPQSIVGVLTTDDSDDRRNVLKDIEKFATARELDFHITNSNEGTDNIIKRLTPDICFVVGWYRIIRKKTLQEVPNGFLGIHHSLLPKYRGGSPLVWAMINGEKVVGTSLFSFSEGMDEGDIWAQESVEVGDTDYISDVMDRLEEKAVHILKEKYIAILEGKTRTVPQDHGRATFCGQRIPEDGLIDWNKSAEKIYNFIRAQSEPYPGAFTFLEGEKLTVWRAAPDNRVYYGTPGQVAGKSGDKVYVICGDNRPIILESVEYGAKKSTAGEIIKSIKTRFKNR